MLGTASWTATVATGGFSLVGTGEAATPTAGIGTGIPPSSVTYAPGLATVSGLPLSLCTPGTAGSLASARVAYSCTGFSSLTATSVTWNPEITVSIAGSNVAGSYSGTITHSVA